MKEGLHPPSNPMKKLLILLVDSIESSKLDSRKDISICLDVAANELINKDGLYSIESSNFITSDNVINYYKNLIEKYPIKSIEDPFAEEDWLSWKKITSIIGKKFKSLEMIYLLQMKKD